MVNFYCALSVVPHLEAHQRKIYVASSWRNDQQPLIVDGLRALGHTVYDFRNPAPNNKGFAWRDCGGEAAKEGPGSGAKTVATYVEAIQSDRASEGFRFDKEALDWADTCIMVLPCGRSAHLEAGYACGQNKHVIWVLSEDKFEPELMYLLGNDFVVPMAFEKTKETSSNVGGIAMDSAGHLYVRFKDQSVYRWEKKAAEHFAALRDAPSPGKYIHANLPKGKRVPGL